MNPTTPNPTQNPLRAPTLPPRTTLSRRAALSATAAAIAAYTTLKTTPLHAGPLDWLTGKSKPARDRDTLIAALAEEPPLPDYPEGEPNAPVTIYEFSSLTCPHCARFHTDTLPLLRERFIDSGEAKLIMRDFPLAPLATAAALLARCVAERGPQNRAGERHRAFIDALFARQHIWAQGSAPLDELVTIARQVGFGRDNVNACFQREDLLHRLNDSAARARDVFEVESTPTFFINGERLVGAKSIDEFTDAINAARQRDQ